MPVNSHYEMSWCDFKSYLRDFEDFVMDNVFQKMEYRMWRKFRDERPANTRVYISKSTNEFNIEIYGEPEFHRFVRGDDSFGDFFFENFLDREEAYDYWMNENMTCIDMYGNIHEIDAKDVKIQSTSSNVYPKKNFKIDFAQSESVKNTALECGEQLKVAADATFARIKDTLASVPVGICAQPVEPTISISLDTKVDKAEFDARIKELTEIIDKHTAKNEKENENMNAFKFDFGPINGNAVRMSMYGMAVKNKAGTWVSYDAKAGEIMDVDVFNFDGANFMYKMPVAMKDIAVGDVIIHHGAPMFVVGKSTDEKGLVVIDVIAGERKEVMLAKSPFGFNFATKVVNFLGNAFNGAANADNPFGNMWMLMAMSGDNKDMKDMLPFMMMANGGMDMSNPMLMYALIGDGKMDPMMLAFMSGAFNPAPAHECKCGGNCGNHNN